MTLQLAILSFLTLDEVKHIYDDSLEIRIKEGISSHLVIFGFLKDRKDKIASFFNDDTLKNDMKLYNFIYRNLGMVPYHEGEFYGQVQYTG